MPYADEEEEEEAADESDSDDDLPLGVAAKLPSDKALVKQVRLLKQASLYFVNHDCHSAEAGLITKQLLSCLVVSYFSCPVAILSTPSARYDEAPCSPRPRLMQVSQLESWCRLGR